MKEDAIKILKYMTDAYKKHRLDIDKYGAITTNMEN